MRDQLIKTWEKYWGEITLNKIIEDLISKIIILLEDVLESDREDIINSYLKSNSSLYHFHRWLYFNTYFDNDSKESEVTLFTSDNLKKLSVKNLKPNLEEILNNKEDKFNEKSSTCPNCGRIGNLIDNREYNKLNNSNLPDFKCEERMKPGCGWVIWIESTAPPYGWIDKNVPSTIYDIYSQNEFSSILFNQIKDLDKNSFETLKASNEFYLNKEIKRKFWNIKNRFELNKIDNNKIVSKLFKKTRENNLNNDSSINNIEKNKISKNQNYFDKIERKVLNDAQKYIGRNRFYIDERIKVINDENINFVGSTEKTKNLSGKFANFNNLRKAKLDKSKNYKSNVDAVFDGICDCITKRKIPPARKVLMSFKKAVVLAKKYNQRPYSCPNVEGKFHLTSMKNIPTRFRDQAFKDLSMYGEEFNKLGIEIGF